MCTPDEVAAMLHGLCAGSVAALNGLPARCRTMEDSRPRGAGAQCHFLGSPDHACGARRYCSPIKAARTEKPNRPSVPGSGTRVRLMPVTAPDGSGGDRHR
jgi:hypothetical protein